MPRSMLERLHLGVMWSRRILTQSGMRCMRCVLRTVQVDLLPSIISTKDDSDNIFMFTTSFMFPQVVLRPQSGQEVNVELFDKDMDKDDFLGR